jgi:hypothetical protein
MEMNRSSVTNNHIVWLAALILLMIVGAVASLLTREIPVPVTVVAAPPEKAPVSSRQSIDLGAGYRLELNGTEGKIFAPERVINPATKSYDLGAGYRLELNGATGKLIPPP